MIDYQLSSRVARVILALSAAFSAACSAPFHMSDTHVTSTPRAPSIDIAVLVCAPVATLGLIAPAGIQGLSPTVSHALTTALLETSPPILAVPMPETLNRLTDQGLAGEYADMLSGFSRNGILGRERLQRIGTALRSRYVLQPGLAEFSQVMADTFEFSGWKLVRTRTLILRLWLQIWDTQTGHILWESTGEVTVATPVVRPESTVSLDEIAQKLWSRIIKDDLLGGKSGSWRCP